MERYFTSEHYKYIRKAAQEQDASNLQATKNAALARSKDNKAALNNARQAKNAQKAMQRKQILDKEGFVFDQNEIAKMTSAKVLTQIQKHHSLASQDPIFCCKRVSGTSTKFGYSKLDVQGKRVFLQGLIERYLEHMAAAGSANDGGEATELDNNIAEDNRIEED